MSITTRMVASRITGWLSRTMILDRKRWGTQAVIAIALSIALLFLGLGGLVSAQSRPIRIYTNGNLANYDVPPTMVQGRVLVPLRGVFEQLGATVDYNAQTQHIVALRGAQTVELTIGSRQARVDGTPRLLDVPAFTITGRTMVPLRFVSESLGANVQWIEASRTILIGTAGIAEISASPTYVNGIVDAVNSRTRR